MDILAALRKGVEYVEALSPVASAFGLVGMTVDAVTGVKQIADNINTRVKEGKQVLNSDNEAELKDLLGRIERENDALMKAVDES